MSRVRRWSSLLPTKWRERQERALERGAHFEDRACPGSRHASRALVWNIGGRCMEPVEIHELPPQACPGPSLILQVRCGKCKACREHRRNLWCARSFQECSQAPRTWFVTLTLRPAEAKALQARAIEFASAKVGDWNSLSTAERVSIMDMLMATELQKYLKRVRKSSNAPIRYLQVVEPHTAKRGGGAHKEMPHWHLLVHETVARATSKLLLRASWKLGFTHARLAKGEDPLYVAKYAAKQAFGRLRASQRYGRPTESFEETDRRPKGSSESVQAIGAGG